MCLLLDFEQEDYTDFKKYTYDVKLYHLGVNALKALKHGLEI